MCECEGIGERAKDQMKGWAGQGRKARMDEEERRGEEWLLDKYSKVESSEDRYMIDSVTKKLSI